MRLSYGEWVVIGLSVIMAAVTWMLGGAADPIGILVSLVASLLVFYVSFRIIRRYYPKSNNWGLVQWTITIFLLGIVLSVIAAIIIGTIVMLLFGGMILSSLGSLPLPGGTVAPAAPAVQPTAEQLPTYDRYGISFQYPEGMSVQEPAVSDTAGLVIIGPPQDMLTVTWISGGDPATLDATMLASLAEMGGKPGITDFQQGDPEKGSHQGHTATYVPVSYTNQGTPFHGGMIWWYCPETQRVFAISIDTIFSQEYARSTLQNLVQSFTCHTD